MNIQGAIIREQGIVFAVVLVKHHVTQDRFATERMIEDLRTIQDFEALPIVLASQDSRGVFEYRGRTDLARFLASLDPSQIPWRTYQIVPAGGTTLSAQNPIRDTKQDAKKTEPPKEDLEKKEEGK